MYIYNSSVVAGFTKSVRNRIRTLSFWLVFLVSKRKAQKQNKTPDDCFLPLALETGEDLDNVQLRQLADFAVVVEACLSGHMQLG